MEEDARRRAVGLFLRAVLCDSLEALAELIEMLEAEGHG